MSSRFRSIVVALGICSAACFCQSTSAAIVTYSGELNNTGPNGPMIYGSDGYDLYATSLDGEPTSSGSIPFGPTRISSLPSYVTSVTSAGANSFFRSNSYATISNPQTNTPVHTGLTYNFSPSNLEKGLLNVNIGAGAPPEFYIGYITDLGDGVWDYPDALRLRQTAGIGSGNSTLITTFQDANRGIDIYFFRISGAQPGDVITTSGIETVGGVNYYNLTAAGLVFTQTIPEPASLSLCGVAMLGLLIPRPKRRIQSFR